MLARCNRGVPALWIIAALVALPTLVQPQIFESGDASPDLCNARSDDWRFSVIREDLLTKLTPFLPFSLSSQQWPSGDDGAQNGTESVDPALLSAYEALSQVLNAEDSAEPTSCVQPDRGRGTPAFAKRISLFFPARTGVFYTPSEENEESHHPSNATSNDTAPPIKYTFTFKPTLPPQPLYSAELRLFKRVASRCDVTFENVEVFYIRSRDGQEHERLFVTSKNVGLIKDEYNSFDVMEAMSKWIENGSNDSLELEVVVNCPFSIASGSFSPPSIEFTRDNSTALASDVEDARPQLVVATITEEVATQLKRRRRKRRQAVDSGYCRNKPTEVHCCIRNLVVNFHSDLNLPWILHPPTFTPNYCQGLCPVPFLGDNYLRLSIQQYYQTNEIGGGPCCTIYGMDSLLMMIRDPRSGEVIFADVPNMEITSCGCVD